MRKGSRLKSVDVPIESVMSLDELLAFLMQIKKFASASVSAVATWVDAAESTLKEGNQIKDMSIEEAQDLVDNRAALLGISTVYLVYMALAGLDAFLRGVCLKALRVRSIVDDSWYSLATVEAVTGVVLAEIPGWSPVKKLYDARTVLDRLEFTVEWDAYFVLQLTDRVSDFAKNFNRILERMKKNG